MTQDKKTILVIDDEKDEVAYFSTFLEDHGYNVFTAGDGNEGLKKVEENKPDLITLDITMPEKSGVRFYREMKENDSLKNIPIIIITGISTDFESFISSRRKVPPPEGFISKPIDQDKLLKLITENIEK
jgi:CheY-like chemotaxis protein